MHIGIDISQLAYKNTGVSNYLSGLVSNMIDNDNENEYTLFFSSMRGTLDLKDLKFKNKNVKIKKFKFPPSFLNLIWNKMHIIPIEWFVGGVDVFITSDWTEPPTKKAKKATIIYDLIVYKHPEETDKKIVSVQKNKLEWVKKESDIVFCISESTKKDAIELLGLNENKISVIYPGL